MPDGPARPVVDAPAGADAPRTVVLIFPGLSIMQRQWLSAGVLVVRCPGCGASQMFSTATAPATFVHERDDCPILRRTEAALARLQAVLGAEAN